MASKNDYLRFSANSIKDLIRINLNSSNVFTDQNFQDSNLSVFLDIVSYMYSMFIYYQNFSGAESMFLDTQQYENINRLVKMIGYNPNGFITSTVSCSMGVKSSAAPGEGVVGGDIYTIPKYTTCNTSQTDANGNQISFSFIDDFTFTAPSNNTIDTSATPLLYNGRFKLYGKQFLTQGIPYETFTLDSLSLVGDTRSYVAHNRIEVYVLDSAKVYTLYKGANNLYNYLGTDKIFEIRINENYQYTLKFGDNINGKRLDPNCTLYVVYLESNGPDGQVGAQALDGTASPAVNIDGLDSGFVLNSFLNSSDLSNQYIKDTSLANISLVNPDVSSLVQDFETVNQIKQNAPVNFRIGSRLITEQDFRQYVLMNYANEVYDVLVMDNNEYMTEFQQWLNLYGKLTPDIVYYSYKYADACDFNNVYVWMKGYEASPVTPTNKQAILQDCNRLKPVTAEVVPMDPFIVTFAPYLDGSYDPIDWDTGYENTIQLVRDRNTMITAERIKQKAVSTVQDFFSLQNCRIGMTVNIDDLYAKLSSIDGVAAVRTAYLKTGEASGRTRYFSGLSFACWTNHIMRGVDLQKVNGNIKLRNFQFPIVYDTNDIGGRIQVIFDSYNVSSNEY
jgi:hypothetical protein